LRRAGGDPAAAGDALRDGGLWPEALVLDTPGILRWAEELVDGERALTAVDHEYPGRWLRVLGESAPPALWRVGELSPLPSISVVGSRTVPSSVTRFCFEVGREAVRLGFAVVSGRAEGCDRASTKGARSVKGSVIEILPHGIELISPPRSGCYLSVCAPEELFSAATAMERNTLIYAASSHAVVGHARFKEGGTWTGAINAVRNRHTTLIVRHSDEPGMRALAGLGGVWLEVPSALGAALKAKAAQRELFDGTG
jgi:predicted Rossmann fold nucleotide-binding protein DprA/Smf involved in DNA uptake